MRKQDLESKTCCLRIGPECDVSGGALPIFVTPIPAIRTYNACMTQSNQRLDGDQTKWEESCYGVSHARGPIERDVAGENKNCDTNDDARSACWQKYVERAHEGCGEQNLNEISTVLESNGQTYCRALRTIPRPKITLETLIIISRGLLGKITKATFVWFELEACIR